MLTPETITRHELAGLPVRVASAPGSQDGTVGRVLRETTQTLVIRTLSGDRQVPKEGTVFEFAIGARLSARPAASDPFVGPTDGTGTEATSGVSAPDGQMSARERGTEQQDHDDGDRDREGSSPTDEAAGDRKAPGTVSQLGSETTGVRPRQSGPSGPPVQGAPANQDNAVDGVGSDSGECEDIAYVTVDGIRLLSRPAERTEQGVSTWR